LGFGVLNNLILPHVVQIIGYNEAGDPIPMEPFNLTREREEGYFDLDGNYIEYRLQGMSDAWLDGLEKVSHWRGAHDMIILIPV
jgi:CD2 antigen cytoplasmic tail-binding protein 2